MYFLQELVVFGYKVLILQDFVVYSIYWDVVVIVLYGVIEFDIEVFSSECSDEEIVCIFVCVQEIGVDVIVGMGGGKILDMVKVIGVSLWLFIVVVFILVLMDVLCSLLVVIYMLEGKFKCYLMILCNLIFVLVDSSIIVVVLVCFLVFGIGDVLVIWFEVEDCCIKGVGNMIIRSGLMIVFELVCFCYIILMCYGCLVKFVCE